MPNIIVRVTEEERRKAKKIAKQQHMDLSSYTRKLLMEKVEAYELNGNTISKIKETKFWYLDYENPVFQTMKKPFLQWIPRF